MGNLVSKAIRPFERRQRPTSTLRDAIVGKPEDQLSDESKAGARVEARLANRHAAEVEQWAANKAVAEAAQAKADDDLLRRIYGR